MTCCDRSPAIVSNRAMFSGLHQNICRSLCRHRSSFKLTRQFESGNHSIPLGTTGRIAIGQRQVVVNQQSAASTDWDWRRHWYPVGFTRDFIIGKPTQVRLFDESYAVVRRRDGQSPIALEDRCPHRAAALSQGRLTPAGHLQCAYHGWSFDGETGKCMNVPQINPDVVLSGRTCATAIPVAEHQGMLWIYPLPGAVPSTSEIPGIPMLDEPNWVSWDYVRDFPIDFTLVLENVADPDHGPFAHQALYFKEYIVAPHQTIHVTAEEERNAFSARSRITNKDGSPGPKGVPTLVFHAPHTVYWYRDSDTWRTTPNLVTAFYVISTGAGKSRLFARYARNVLQQVPFPRWLHSIAVSSFLDQDTYMLASQQPAVLQEEVKYAMEAQENGTQTRPLRRRMFCYRSPTDNLLVEMGKWLDTHVPSVPNRYRSLIARDEDGSVSLNPAFQTLPPREQVLDRYSNQVVLVPEVVQAYNRFKAAAGAFHWLTVVLTATLASSSLSALSTSTGVSSGVEALAHQGALLGGTVLSLLVTKGLEGLVKQFEFVYTQDKQDADLDKLDDITAGFIDEQRTAGKVSNV